MGNHRYGIDNEPVLWSGYLMLMNEEMMSSYLFRPQPHWGETVRDGGQYSPNPKEGRQRRQWHPTPVLLPGKSHGRRSLEGCSPWGRYESDTTEWLHFHFSLSCIGEGNGNPLQYSCLENPRDGGAWWAAVCGVAQSRTRLKRLSSSSSKEGRRPHTFISVSWESRSESNFYGSVKHRSPRHCYTWTCGRKMHADSANGVWAAFTEGKEKLVWLCGWGTLSQFNVQMLLLLHLYVSKNWCFYFPLS